MAGNLTAQVRNIAEVTTAVATGDLSRKITVDVPRRGARAQEHDQHMVDQLRSFASEVTPGGPRGRHRRQARRPGARRGRVGTGVT